MTTTVKNKQLPYLKDTGLDGKKLYTPNEWMERLRHYIKRFIISIKNRTFRESNTDKEQTDGKRTRIMTRLYLGSWIVTNREHNQRRVQHGPRHNNYGKITTTFQRLLHSQVYRSFSDL